MALITNVWTVLRSKHSEVGPYDPSAFVLGTITSRTFCSYLVALFIPLCFIEWYVLFLVMFVDKQGIVAEPMPLPGNIVFFSFSSLENINSSIEFSSRFATSS